MSTIAVMDRKIISVVKEEPSLYTKLLPKVERDKIWKHLADTLGSEANLVSRRWYILRECYLRARNTGLSQSKFAYKNEMKFLDAYTEVKKDNENVTTAFVITEDDVKAFKQEDTDDIEFIDLETLKRNGYVLQELNENEAKHEDNAAYAKHELDIGNEFGYRTDKTKALQKNANLGELRENDVQEHDGKKTEVVNDYIGDTQSSGPGISLTDIDTKSLQKKRLAVQQKDENETSCVSLLKSNQLYESEEQQSKRLKVEHQRVLYGLLERQPATTKTLYDAAVKEQSMQNSTIERSMAHMHQDLKKYIKLLKNPQERSKLQQLQLQSAKEQLQVKNSKVQLKFRKKLTLKSAKEQLKPQSANGELTATVQLKPESKIEQLKPESKIEKLKPESAKEQLKTKKSKRTADASRWKGETIACWCKRPIEVTKCK